MRLQENNESLSSALFRWSIAFNENLELDNKDYKTIENYMNVINKFIEYISSNIGIDKKENLININDKFIKRYFNWRDEEHKWIFKF